MLSHKRTSERLPLQRSCGISAHSSQEFCELLLSSGKRYQQAHSAHEINITTISSERPSEYSWSYPVYAATTVQRGCKTESVNSPEEFDRIGLRRLGLETDVDDLFYTIM